jgi:hypothetical protein
MDFVKRTPIDRKKINTDVLRLLLLIPTQLFQIAGHAG